MIIIGNGSVLTRDPNNPWIENGAVVVSGSIIEAVGEAKLISETYPGAEFLDARGGVIMPAFINTHEHIYSAMARGLSINGYHPNGFLDILEGMWWTIDRNLTKEQVKKSAAVTYIDCIKNGVTTVFDHHASYGFVEGSLLTIAGEAKRMGVRTCLCYEVSDRESVEKMQKAVLENETFFKLCQADSSGMVKAMMGLHAQFTLSDQTLSFCREHMPEGIGVHIHVAEGMEDLHDSIRKHGKRIINRLMDFELLSRKCIAAHCIYINPQEMELLKETETMVVHNPESNMGNACGCPPTMELMRRGILTGLGTDGYTHDMLESMKVANVLHKHNLCDANAAWEEVPKMLFENNKEIANRFFDTPIGVLKEGYVGDVIVSEYLPFTPMGADNSYGHILFGMNGKNIVTTMANGKILMKNRELTGIDEEKEIAECKVQAAKLWKSING